MTLQGDARITRIKRKIKDIKRYFLFLKRSRQFENLDYNIHITKEEVEANQFYGRSMAQREVEEDFLVGNDVREAHKLITSYKDPRSKSKLDERVDKFLDNRDPVIYKQ